MTDTFFDGKSVVPVSLEDWMKWASNQKGADWHVVLPMIQRGSVWAPHKLLDMWDTLLRGMPIGAMMASETEAGKSITEVGKKETRKSTNRDIHLIDGQQRTLSMLAGWPQGLENPLHPVTIWVDLTDVAQGEYQFRLWVTTQAQPYGYARASMGGQPLIKLERYKLRLANQAWGRVDPLTLWNQPDFMPWEAKFALPLTELIANTNRLQEFVQEQLLSYRSALEAKPNSDSCSTDEIAHQVSKHFEKRLKELPTGFDLTSLERAIDKVLACEFPVIHVQQESFDNLANESENDQIDPPLAILFKRVGTGGEALSNADYVYSVIKHHAPDVHNTVEKLLEDQRIRAIYMPTTLVMSAVRLTMQSLAAGDSTGKKFTDSANLNKATFARLVRNHEGFIDEFKKAIAPDGVFVTSLKQVLDNLSYERKGFDTGLPKHALCLIQIPLLEIILAWCALRKPDADTMKLSRLPMVRFILQGNLCVLDYAKASVDAIKMLRDNNSICASAIFPDQALLNLLSTGDNSTARKATAYPLPSPETLSAIVGLYELPLTVTPDGISGLRGWTRFSVPKDEDKRYAEVYKRWWNRKGGHTHPMLLWLQRKYVFDTFEEQPALAGMDEETPFDFDHILPSAHWHGWTGTGNENRFINFPLMDEEKDEVKRLLDNTGHWHIGNSIGNIHVMESGKNRSLGDMSVENKLKVEKFAENALVLADDRNNDWLDASGNEKEPRVWKESRALAFQRAVERRTFALYSQFHAALFPKETTSEERARKAEESF